MESFTTPASSSLNRAPQRAQLAIKRLLDVTLSILALIALSPLFLLLALIVRHTSPGPILFRQPRLGRHGRVFTMLKFRTMYDDAPVQLNADGSTRVVDHDPRVTPPGELMRRLALDELPQLWNVLRGEMSLVGPRPDPAFYRSQYHGDDVLKLEMRPGLTALAHVMGRQLIGWRERFPIERRYIEQFSLWLDVKIMLLTLVVLWRGVGVTNTRKPAPRTPNKGLRIRRPVWRPWHRGLMQLPAISVLVWFSLMPWPTYAAVPSPLPGALLANLPSVAAPADGGVFASLVAGTTLYVGGSFKAVGGEPRSNLAAVDLTTGKVLPWSPDPDGPVHALELSGEMLFVGGFFGSIAGQPRTNLASFTLDTGRLSSWSPLLDDGVFALLPSDNTLIVGGQFTRANKQRRTGLARFTLATGRLDNWRAKVSGKETARVVSLAIAGKEVYVGGEFTSANRQPRANFAAFHSGSGALRPLVLNTDAAVNSLAVSGTTLWLGGAFTTINGQQRPSLAAADIKTRQPLPWATDANGPVQAFALGDGAIYVGGLFTRIGGAPHRYLAQLDLNSGQTLGWNPKVNAPVATLSLDPSGLYVGGRFATVDGEDRGGLVGYSLDAPVPVGFTPRPDYNGDGKADFLWYNRMTGATAFWGMDGTSRLLTGSPPAIDHPGWRPVATYDFDGDQTADVLWRNLDTGENHFWFLSNGTWRASAVLPTVPELEWKVVNTFDFDHDGQDDLLWRNTINGANAFWKLKGITYGGYFGLDTVPELEWKLAGAGDFDGDGNTDLLWRNATTGANALWLMNGVVRKEDANGINTLSDQTWLVAGVADFNHDKRADILWWNSVTGAANIWLLDGYDHLRMIDLPAMPGATITSLRDQNGDGMVDLVWYDAGRGWCEIWLMRDMTPISRVSFSMPADPAWQVVDPRVSTPGTGIGGAMVADSAAHPMLDEPPLPPMRITPPILPSDPATPGAQAYRIHLPLLMR